MASVFTSSGRGTALHFNYVHVPLVKPQTDVTALTVNEKKLQVYQFGLEGVRLIRDSPSDREMCYNVDLCLIHRFYFRANQSNLSVFWQRTFQAHWRHYRIRHLPVQTSVTETTNGGTVCILEKSSRFPSDILVRDINRWVVRYLQGCVSVMECVRLPVVQRVPVLEVRQPARKLALGRHRRCKRRRLSVLPDCLQREIFLLSCCGAFPLRHGKQKKIFFNLF